MRAIATWQYDVIVVGAGPAGAKAAEAASRHGVRVLLVDKRSQPGMPVQCAEFVPLAVRRYARLAPGSVAQKVEEMQTFVNGRLVSTMAAPGYVLNRSIFDAGLVRRAQDAGAELRLRTRAVSRTERGITVRGNGRGEEEITCGVIIGADGPRSTVSKWIGSQNRNFMSCIQYRLPLYRPLANTEIYFSPEYTGGYAWLFPKGDTANVGVGGIPALNCRLRGLLQDFIRQMVMAGKLAGTEPLGRTGGLAPAGGPLPVTQRDHILLVGDAAGHTHPVTGAGIMSAIVCGELAGQAAAQAIIHEDMTLLANYPREWQKSIGRFLEKGSRQREDYDRNWTDHPEQFTALINRVLGFRGSFHPLPPEA